MKKNSAATAFSLYETAAGFGVLAANDAGLVAHQLPFGTKSAEEALQTAASLHPSATGPSALTEAGAALLKRYFAGEKVVFDLSLDLGGFTDFQRAVYMAVAKIPYGVAMSYAEVAAVCGSPKGARAVGGAMARNPLPILIPCHRVMGATGLLTGFTAPGGVGSKRELLVMEGTVFQVRGGVLEAQNLRL